MQTYGIYSPVMGLRKDVPSIFLNKSFTPDCDNIQFWNGEVRTAKMRLKELMSRAGELVVNGAFATDTDWVKGVGWTFDTDKMSYTKGADDTALTQTILSLIAGKSYTVTYTISASSLTGAGTIAVSLGGTAGTDRTADGTYTEVLECGATQVLSFSSVLTLGDTFKIDAVSVQKVEQATVQTPDGNPVIKYLNHITDGGSKYLLAFTSEHIYYWSTAACNWIPLFTSGSSCTYWSVASFNGKVYATNNVDEPQKWSGSTGDNFVDLDAAISSGVTITNAKFVAAHEGHLFLLGITYSGQTYYNNVAWSDLDDESDFTPAPDSDAGEDYVDGDGIISGVGTKGEFLYVFKDKSISRYWYTGSELLYASHIISPSIGTSAPDSIVNDGSGKLYFYGSDLIFREVEDGPLGTGLNELTRDINQGVLLVEGIRSAFIAEYGELWWAVPSGAAATANNQILVYKGGIWSVRSIAVSAFGSWTRQSEWTWDTLPYDTWDSWDWASWDSVQTGTGWPIDLCADYDGYTYSAHESYTDNGAAYTSYFVMNTDLGEGGLQRYYKRLWNLLVYLQKAGDDTLSVYIKEDNEPDWQLAGEISLTGTPDILIQEIPVDFRAKSFLVKVQSTKPFRFLGIEFDYELSGTR